MDKDKQYRIDTESGDQVKKTEDYACLRRLLKNDLKAGKRVQAKVKFFTFVSYKIKKGKSLSF